MRAHVASLPEQDRQQLQEKLRQDFAFPHCAYAVPAWGLMVLPGPGRDSDPHEEHYDWTPGLGTASRHFASFPSYVANHLPPNLLAELEKRTTMWERMRTTLRRVPLSGIRSDHSFACWGLVNLTTEHARSEALRQTTSWNLKPLWRVIEVCRPALIIAPTSIRGGARCHERVQRLLGEKGALPQGKTRRYRADKGSRTWDFRSWETPLGQCCVGKMHTQPSYWGNQVADILAREASHIADVARLRDGLESISSRSGVGERHEG